MSRPVRFAVATLIGTALALVAYPLLAVVGLMTAATPGTIGMTKQQAKLFLPNITQHGLIGLWLSLLAVCALVLVAVGRGLSAPVEKLDRKSVAGRATVDYWAGPARRRTPAARIAGGLVPLQVRRGSADFIG